MVVTFFSEYLNHHQIPIAEAYNSIAGVTYFFVSTKKVPEFRKRLGYSDFVDSYLIDTTVSDDQRELAKKLAIESDVAIFAASGVLEYIIPRLELGKVTFECSERWFKKPWKLNMLSPNLWRQQLLYRRFRDVSNFYMLCCSAYAPNDYYFLGSFRGRCYKWGYFPKVGVVNIDRILADKRGIKTRIMWCSRFINWKHPEIVIRLAILLKKNGYQFDIDMYGVGALYDTIKNRINKYKLSDCVHLQGAIPNDDVLLEMRNHHILLATSDRNEGWGAIINEAMSNGCTVVASDMMGSVPFLIDSSNNGLIYKTNEIDELYKQVVKLIENPDLCEALAVKAYADISTIWSPENAANRFIALSSALVENRVISFPDGPCSVALPCY